MPSSPARALRSTRSTSRAPLEALVALAHTVEEITVPAGASVARRGGPRASLLVIVDGTALGTDRPQASGSLGRGDPIGGLEMLGGLPYDETVEALTPIRALKIEAASLFDVIEDHMELGRAILTVLAEDLLDAPESLGHGAQRRTPISSPRESWGS